MKYLIIFFSLFVSISFSMVQKGNCPFCTGTGKKLYTYTDTFGDAVVTRTVYVDCSPCKGTGNFGTGPEIVPPKMPDNYQSGEQIIDGFMKMKPSPLFESIMNGTYQQNQSSSKLFEDIMSGKQGNNNGTQNYNSNTQNSPTLPSSIPVPCEHRIQCTHRIPCIHLMNTPWGWKNAHPFDTQHQFDLLHQYDFKKVN